MVADVPVVCYLSGGIDSCSILGLADAISQSPVKAFTIGFDGACYDEAPTAREMAESCRANQDVITLSAEEPTATLSPPFDIRGGPSTARWRWPSTWVSQRSSVALRRAPSDTAINVNLPIRTCLERVGGDWDRLASARRGPADLA